MGINHIRTAPGHPQSNGQVLRYVDTVKKVISKGLEDEKTLNVALREFLIRHRSTPHSTTGQAACELFLNRKMLTELDVTNPSEVALITARERQKRKFLARERKSVYLCVNSMC